MLVPWLGELYYHQHLSWCLSATLAGGCVAAAALAWRPVLQQQCGIDEPTKAVLLVLVDYTLAAALLLGILLGVLRLNFTRRGCRVELYVLRCLSATIASIALLQLTVLILPRPVLVAAAVLCTCMAINAACWWSDLWLHLQAGGLASVLPETLRHTLTTITPLEWLRDDALSVLLGEWFAFGRQLLPLTLLPESDLPMALEALPAKLRAQLLKPGLQVPGRARRETISPLQLRGPGLSPADSSSALTTGPLIHPLPLHII